MMGAPTKTQPPGPNLRLTKTGLGWKPRNAAPPTNGRPKPPLRTRVTVLFGFDAGCVPTSGTAPALEAKGDNASAQTESPAITAVAARICFMFMSRSSR